MTGEEFEAYLERCATQKLEQIISREGDANGKRREPWYLETLKEELRRECQHSILLECVNLE